MSSFSIDDDFVEEPTSGTTQCILNVTIRKRIPPISQASVEFFTENGTATQTISDESDEKGDYEAASDTLTFSPTQGKKEISITINPDSEEEAAETFKVILKNPSQGFSIQKAEGVCTITIPGETKLCPDGNRPPCIEPPK